MSTNQRAGCASLLEGQAEHKIVTADEELALDVFLSAITSKLYTSAIYRAFRGNTAPQYVCMIKVEHPQPDSVHYLQAEERAREFDINNPALRRAVKMIRQVRLSGSTVLPYTNQHPVVKRQRLDEVAYGAI